MTQIPLLKHTHNGQKLSYRHLKPSSDQNTKRRIVFFHGFPASSALIRLFEPYIQDGIEVLSLDRPGYGQSDLHPVASQMQNTVDLAKAMVGHLGWNQYEVFTISGGTPFGLTFAYQNPAAVLRATVVSGMGPLALPEFRQQISATSFWGLKAMPYLPGALAKKAVKRRSTKRPLVLKIFLPTSAVDNAILSNPMVSGSLQQAISEAFAQNGAGPKRDAQTYLAPWGWELKDFSCPLTLWHGEEDLIMPPGMAEQFHKSINGSCLKITPNAGHYSLAIENFSEILGRSG